jgi:putative heme-binding domain-containing protein
MIDGKGGFIASDLSLYGADASAEEIRSVILNPGENLPPQKKAVAVVTNDGEAFTGVLRVEDNFSLSLQTLDGAFHFFQKSNLAKIDFGSHSLMPETYGSTLTNAEVDDLIAYLIRTGTERANASGTKHSKSDDDYE